MNRFFHLIGVLLFWFAPARLPGQTATTYYSICDNANFRTCPDFLEKISFSSVDFKRLNAVVFFLTNEIRIKYNLNPLEFNQKLENSATMHARDMVENDFFSHENHRERLKKTPNDRGKINGIGNPFVAENIAEGYGLRYRSNQAVFLRGKGQFSLSPNGPLIVENTYLSLGEAVIEAWMNSKSHRLNILAPKALQLGCGSAFFIDKSFNEMPSFMMVQNFQWYQRVQP